MRHNKPLFFLVISLFTISLSFCFAQNDEKIFIGKVVDVNGNPVNRVNVLNITNKSGTITDRNGFFFITIDKFPLLLEISYVGYKKKFINVTKADYENQEEFYKIVLEKDIIMLQEFEVVEEQDFGIFQSRSTNVLLDYRITKEDIFVLLKSNSKRRLRMIDRITKKWYILDLPIKANEIYKDCKGNFHLITKDSIYQFYINNIDSTVFLYSGYSLDKFYKTLSNCTGFINNKFIFRDYSAHNQKTEYWYIDKNEKKILYSVFDRDRYLFAQSFLNRKNELLHQYGHIDEMGDISIDQLHIARKIMQLEFAYKMIGKIPAYNPLFVFNDTIVIFNHVADSVCFINNNFLLCRTVPIKYSENKTWNSKIYFDNLVGRFYVEFDKAGIISLCELDINTGDLGRVIRLDNCIFPEKICVYDNTVYYIDDNILTNKKVLRSRVIE